MWKSEKGLKNERQIYLKMKTKLILIAVAILISPLIILLAFFTLLSLSMYPVNWISQSIEWVVKLFLPKGYKLK